MIYNKKENHSLLIKWVILNPFITKKTCFLISNAVPITTVIISIGLEIGGRQELAYILGVV